MVVRGYNISRRHSTWVTDKIMWIPSVNIWSNPPKFITLDWSYFHRPTKFGWQWCSSFLQPNSHHQITFSRYNFTVEYLPPYERLVWDYNKAKTESIKQAFMQINWQNLFLNKDVHQQVRTLNDTVINFFSNFVPNKIVSFDDRDPP